MSRIERITKDKQIIAVVCNQVGDTGKGKITDILAASWADIIARGTGGNNAGHTVVINGKQRIFHLLPSGIVYSNQGKTSILGNGMVIDLRVLCGELDELDREETSYNNLMISEDAHVIMPYHIERDKAKNESQKKGGIGSTGRGIGPCYTDKIARRGIFIRDLFYTYKLVEKIKKATEFYPDIKISVEQIVEELKPYAERIKPFVRDTISEMHKSVRMGKKILLEGAQGLLLSIEFGTYPYVTSSDCSINGTAAGVGLSARAVDLPLGIVKFPYMTRVGAGPFPTEFGGRDSEVYCADGLEHNVNFELEHYRIPFKLINGELKYDHHHLKILELMNSDNPFLQGVGIRLAGAEYGATTKRPRRTGWTDLVALKYAIGINGPDIVLTKVDVLQGAEQIKLARRYTYAHSESVDNFTRKDEALRYMDPIYNIFEGFSEDISQIRDHKDLPSGLQQAIKFLETHVNGRVRMISTGPEQKQVIIK